MSMSKKATAANLCSLLSRAHSNYLAQINIRMNERAEETNDVLGKLTVLGTIVLPMNIVTVSQAMRALHQHVRHSLANTLVTRVSGE